MKCTKNKHLTLDERTRIEGGLDHGMTFKGIAHRIGKDQTTVSKEVKRHLYVVASGVRTLDVDGKPIAPEICPRLLRVPFVCNGCSKRRSRCKYDKQLYRATRAQADYKALLCESREGVPLNREAFYAIDALIADGFSRGQRLYHILKTNNLAVSQSTVYRHLHRGLLSVSKLDFPRVVKFKPRKQVRTEHIPKALKVNRTHADFLLFIEEYKLSAWVEMDTVIGRIGGKCLLTLNFTFCNFMIGLLLDNKSSAEVACKISGLKQSLAAAGLPFGTVFPVILTDNGGEFSNVFAIENNAEAERETHLFFCDPYQSAQKPFVEKNHTLLRDIVPKGSSFDSFSQDTVNRIFSHINSVKRKSLNGKSAYDMFAFTFGASLPDALKILPVPATQVIQSPKLLQI